MGLLSASLLEELRRPHTSVFPVLEIDDRDSTTRRFGKAGVASASLGMYQPRVLRWGTLTRASANYTNTLQRPGGQVTLDDTDGAVRAYLHKLQNRPARIKLVSPNLTAADYFILFTGIVESFTDDGFAVTLNLAQDDEWLDSPVPRARITVQDWPDAAQDVLGQWAPMVLGVHEATGSFGGLTGMVPALKVETTQKIYIISHPACKAVDAVYSAGVAKTIGTIPTQDCQINLKYTRGGRHWTAIQFTADQGNDAITANVQGAETISDGSGTLITNPVSQLRLLLINFVANDFKSGSYAGDTGAPIHTASWDAAEDYFDAMAYRGAIRIGGTSQMTGRSVLNAVALDHDLYPYWTNGGQLALGFYDHRLQNDGLYPSTLMRGDTKQLGSSFRAGHDPQAWVPRHIVQWGLRAYDGKYLRTVEAWDRLSSNQRAESRAGLWLPAQTGYDAQVREGFSRKANRWRNFMGTLSGDFPLDFCDLELFTDFAVSWDRGWNLDGTVGWGGKNWEAPPHRLVAVTYDLEAMKVSAVAENLRQTQTSFRLSGKTDAPLDGAPEDGLLHLNAGGARSYTRSGYKGVEDASGILQRLAADKMPFSKHGLLLEEARTNDILRGVSNTGLTGITVNGTGTNGSAITAASAPLLWDAQVAANVVKILTGTPNTVDTYINEVGATTWTANKKLRYSFWTNCDTADTPVWAAVRGVDGFSWNNGTAAWGAAFTWNDANNGGSSAGLWKRSWSKTIDVGGAATAVTWYLGWKSTSGNGKVVYVGHRQVEEGLWPSSEIWTDGATQTRGIDNLRWANDGASSKKLLPYKRFTFQFKFVPNWDHADLASGRLCHVFRLLYSAGNSIELYYDATNSRWEVFANRASVNSVSNVQLGGGLTPLRGKPIQGAVRLTSDQGELGIGNHSLDILMGGISGYASNTIAKGTTVQLAGFLNEAASANWFLGSSDGTQRTIDGYLYDIHMSPFCIPDNAIGQAISD